VKHAWSGRAGFVLATIASAVGLGSIWKFPYEVGENGGAAFVLFYVLGLALAVVTGVLVLSFYSVIGGWTLAYAFDPALPYDTLLAGPGRMAAWPALFLALAALVVARGVGGGIEVASKVLMPLLVLLMLALTAYGVVAGDVGATLRYLFRLDLSGFSALGALEALGLGFFSIGVGFGLMITYAAYAGARIDLRQVALWSVGADTAISLAAGFAVFPLVFANGLDPASGPGLVFVTLPLAFARMPFGDVAAVAFFALLFVAALASAISLLELAVALAGELRLTPRGTARTLAARLIRRRVFRHDGCSALAA
jgi:NSS family neurotransmitter:Na+ symporter